MTDRQISLGGKWTIVKDSENIGRICGYALGIPDAETEEICVPRFMPSTGWAMHFSYSNVFPGYHGAVWYYKLLEELPLRGAEELILLEFDRAGYLCEVYINGAYLGEHRHHEERFSFDITQYVKGDGSDLLAVRCFEPLAIGEPIDGITLARIPNGVWANSADVLPGVADTFCMECFGGITGEVRLLAAPRCRIDDVFIRPNPHTGDVEVRATVINATDAELNEKLMLSIVEQKRGVDVCLAEQSVTIPVGMSEVSLCVRVEDLELWELDRPFLYIARLTTTGGSSYTARFGFRELTVKNGYFFLNGKRFLIKGAHAIPSAADVVSMKALGFNMIRSIHRSFIKEVMDVCDEIGMLVMESPVTAWGMTMHENTAQMVFDYTANMVRLHRNHPSLLGFYIFNELHDLDIMHCGADALPRLRALSPDSLFFLSSGRWDAESSLGSASSPRSETWDICFGAEGISGYPDFLPRKFQGGHTAATVGDIHPYMNVPVDAETREWFRTMGADTQPILVSETGIGSQCDPMRSYLAHSQRKLMDVITVDTVKRVWELVDEFIDFYGFRHIYPQATDICRDADLQNGAARRLVFDMIRSNPKINGYSLTSVGTGNEGTFEGGHGYVVKETVAHALQEGWEPLRWALFSSERVVYANRPFKIEAVLCNEDLLPPGVYAAQAYIRGKDGCVFSRDFKLNYPEEGFGGMPPLAASVFSEEISLPEGEYTFCIRLLEGGAPFGGTLPISVIAPKKKSTPTVYLFNMPRRVEKFLTSYGIEWRLLDSASRNSDVGIVLAGDAELSEYETLLRPIAEKGGKVILTNTELLAERPELVEAIAGEGARSQKIWGRLYHHDCVAISHPVFDGLQNAGLLDVEKYGDCYPRWIIGGGTKPTRTLCAAIRIEATLCGTGLVLGEYAVGAGGVMICAFRLAETIGEFPFADRLLLNLISFEAEKEL